MTAAASAGPGESMRRRAIQSGIEWPHRRLGALGIEADEQPRPLVGNAAAGPR